MAIKINGTNTAAAPGITGDDTDTGLVYGTNQIDFSTGGTSRATIDSTGNLNIPNDSGKLQLGTSADLQIYHNGSNSNVVNTGGQLLIRSTTALQLGAPSGEIYFAGVENGSAELYYNNSKKFETTSTGAKVTGADLTVIGTEGISAGLFLIADEGDDNGDGWRINSNQDANDLTLANNTSGSYADKLTLTKEGNISVSGSGLSDRDLKDNIATVTTTALEKIKQLVPKTFTWKKYDNNRTFTGFIAQDVESVLPILVNGTDGEKNMSLDYNGVLAYAVKAITELSAEVETLKTKVAALEAG